MKMNRIIPAAWPYLIIGLLLVTSGTYISNAFALPKFVPGFLLGLGMMLEFIGLTKINRKGSCKFFKNEFTK
jgi:hypothetical protein